MADFARYLPLSSRAAVDETGVSNDWRPSVAQRLRRLETLAPTLDWSEPTRSGASVSSVLGGLVQRLESTRRERFARRLRIGADAREPDRDGIIAAIASCAAARESGVGPHGVAELVAVVTAELALGGDLGLPARISGAVALHLTLAAPLPIRAVVRDRTLIASDAGWRFGSGEPIEAPAEDLLLLLCGIGPVPR